ncbi:MAG: TetR/AcrR family transcriptional regulator [Myxococcales bacterium]|nr:TetR/AcrR family transcriptional regulator [Myxococcales bacterium]
MKEVKKPDRRTLRSRRLLQDALLVLLEEKDYDQISVADIAERAKVSRPTFYAHYKTKDELLLSYFDRIFESTFEGLEQAVKNKPPFPHFEMSILSQFMTAVFTQWHKHRALLETLLRSSGEGLVLRRFQENTMTTFAWLLQQEHIHPIHEHLLRLLADYFSGVALALVKYWLEEGFVSPAEKMGAIYSVLVRPGIEQVLGGDELAAFFEEN